MVTERSPRGPILGIPLLYDEWRRLMGWARAQPTWYPILTDALLRLELHRDDIQALAAACATSLPAVATSCRAVLEDPADLPALTQDERLVLQRMRATPHGSFRITVTDGTPTIAAERHWQWHSGGTVGYIYRTLDTLITTLRAETRPPQEVLMLTETLRRAQTALAQVVEATDALTQGCRTLDTVLRDLEAATAQLEQWEAAAARLALIRHVLDPDLPAPTLPAAAASPVPARSARDRVWHLLQQWASQGKLPATSAAICRALEMPRRTVRRALQQLTLEGRVTKDAGPVPRWHLTPSAPILDPDPSPSVTSA
jgi:hypothetical protein